MVPDGLTGNALQSTVGGKPTQSKLVCGSAEETLFSYIGFVFLLPTGILMNSIQSSLYTVAIALCVFSAGLLRDRRSRTGRLPAWFMTFLAIETLGFAFELLMVHPDTPLKALWLGLRMTISLLVAPCLWLAVRETVEGVRPRLSALSRGHWAAIVAGVVLLFPLVETAHLGFDYPDPHRVVSQLHSRVIHGTMLLCIAIFAVQVPYYLWQCRRLLLIGAGRSTLKWLQLPLVVVLTTWALGLLRTVHCATHAPKGLSLLFALTDVGVTVGAMYSIIRRLSLQEREQAAGVLKLVDVREENAPASAAVLVTTAPITLCPVAEPNQVTTPPAFSSEKPTPVAPFESSALPPGGRTAAPETKYARSKLNTATRERIKRKLENAMTTGKLCQDSLLNLRSLSRHISEKAHYVSQVINQDMHLSFYALVNYHRITQAKKLLIDAPGQTVLKIALAVGFNSKSTFNTAFRQNTGITPSEYRRGAGNRTE